VNVVERLNEARLFCQNRERNVLINEGKNIKCQQIIEDYASWKKKAHK